MHSGLLGRVWWTSVMLGAAVAVSSGCGDLSLVDAPPCDPGETRSCEGECSLRPGVQTCGARGWGPCEGAGTVEPEVCNGRDDDCDGRVDESYPEEGESCGVDVGPCTSGQVACGDGFLECMGASQPREEICNGVDDDCDGEVDEEIPERLCYEGPAATRGVGICHGGVLLCRNGRPTCVGQQLPLRADCANGLDNNCDGYLDPPEEAPKADIVLLVDKSGSMLRTLEALRQALTEFLESMRQWSDVRVAVVAVPGSAYSDCVVVQPFSPPDAALDFASTFTTDGGAEEPTLDCAMGVAHPSHPLGLEWAPEANRLAVLFTDEACQSDWCQDSCGHATSFGTDPHWCTSAGFSPEHRLTVQETAEALATAGIRMEVFTTQGLGGGSDEGIYSPLAAQSGGRTHDLEQTVAELAEVIQRVLMSSVCG